MPLDPRGAARMALAHGGTVRAGASRGDGELPGWRELCAPSTLDCPDVDEAQLQAAWELARSPATLAQEDRRALFHLALAAVVNRRRGSTRMPLEGDGPTLRALLGEFAVDEELSRRVFALVRAPGGAAEVLGSSGDARPLVVDRDGDGDGVYIQRQRVLEERFVARLAGLAAATGGPVAAPRAEVDAAVDDVRAGGAHALRPAQADAVRAALLARFTLITGGPGTGKTSIITALLRALVRLGVAPADCALAAPTGKAAHRMSEAVRAGLAALVSPASVDAELARACPEAKTLHRLLGYSPRTDHFKHHARNPLEHRVVLVDEASMIDLALMDRLVSALRPDASLVLLGDADQLPSVDAGAVFRDLVPGPSPTDLRARFTVRLTESHRMNPARPAGRNILMVAQAMNEGRVGELFTGAEQITRRAVAAELAFEGVEFLPLGAAAERTALAARWVAARLKGDDDHQRRVRAPYRLCAGQLAAEHEADVAALFAHLESSRVLCLLRDARGGGAAAEWNEELGELCHPSVRARERARRPGTPVLMQKNDYGRGLWNGDLGVILSAGEDAASCEPRALFRRGGGFVAFPLGALAASLEAAWAMTVHKAQGSELDAALLVLPPEDGPLLAREILYTAVTRARRSVVIAGDEALLLAGVGRRLVRHSGIVARLTARLA